MRHVVSRLERLPYCSWHLKMRLIICTAWFFDAFDSIAIAYVLPPIIGLWHLNPQQIGLLIGTGFAGQLVGAIGFGWLAEHWGRRLSMLMTLLIFSLGALACAAAPSYQALCVLRFIQGIGLGGEIPLMAAYLNEFARAENRGRFSLSVQVLFALGLLAVAVVSVYVVPHWGWQWMFVIGALPALVAIPMRSVLPESPRWLASQGRSEEADLALKRIEDAALRDGRSPCVAAAGRFAGSAASPSAHRRTVQGHLSESHYLGVVSLDWCLFRLVWHHRLDAVAVPHRLSSRRRAIEDLWPDHERRRALRHGDGDLSHRYGSGRRPLLMLSLGGCSIPLISFAFLPQLTAAETLAVATAGFGFSQHVAGIVSRPTRPKSTQLICVRLAGALPAHGSGARQWSARRSLA